MVKAGNIGAPEILKITSRDPAPPPEEFLRSSGGIFFDMTIHDFDMARYLMGSEVVEVYARATVLVDDMFRKVNDWDTALVSLRFENGAVGAIDNSRRAVYGYDQRAEVFGSSGMVATSNNAPDNHVYFDRSGGHSSPPLNFFMERYTESYRRDLRRVDRPASCGGSHQALDRGSWRADPYMLGPRQPGQYLRLVLPAGDPW